MKRTHLVVLFIALSFLFVSAAPAEMYVGIKAGYVQVSDMDITIPAEEEEAPPEEVGATELNIGAGYSGDLEYDAGYVIGAAIGTAIDNYRVEGELEFRSSDFGASGVSGDETLKTTSLMLNGYYDFNMDSAITPFLGAGIGWAKHDFGEYDDSVFAYQFTVGAAYALTDTMDLDLAYRYFATADPEIGDEEGKLELDYASHNITVGIRFKL